MSIRSILSRGIRYILHGTPVINVTASISTLEPSHSLDGRRIIITGGGRGLGLAMARQFINEGAQVLITGRDEKTLASTARDLGCLYDVLDVTRPELFEDFITRSANRLGGLDTLVNNAGISLHEKSFFDVTPSTFDAQIDTNFKGAFFLTQAFIRHLQSCNGGQPANILFISSETGDTMDCRPYGYTKAAINSMVQGLAYLFKKQHIRINAIAPGVTATDMTGAAKDGNLYAGEYGEGRVYLPVEVAQAATFLISPAAACISGQIITCNNAQTINARWK